MTPAVCVPVLQHLKTKTSYIHLYKIKHLKSIHVNIILLAVPIVVFWGPYGGLLMKEWMKCIYPRFTPSRITLMESAQEAVSLTRLFDLI